MFPEHAHRGRANALNMQINPQQSFKTNLNFSQFNVSHFPSSSTSSSNQPAAHSATPHKH